MHAGLKGIHMSTFKTSAHFTEIESTIRKAQKYIFISAELQEVRKQICDSRQN